METMWFSQEPKRMPVVLACITGAQDCDTVIEAGWEISNQEHLPLRVINVQPRAHAYSLCNESLEYLFDLSRKAGAEMSVYYHDDRLEAITSSVRRQSVVHILTGSDASGEKKDFLRGLVDRFPNVPVEVVDPHGERHRVG